MRIRVIRIFRSGDMTDEREFDVEYPSTIYAPEAGAPLEERDEYISKLAADRAAKLLASTVTVKQEATA